MLWVCKYYGYTKEYVNLLFNKLILSIFYFGVEVCGSAFDSKYLSQFDSFLRRTYRFGYISELITINEKIDNRDRKMWKMIITNPRNPLNDLLSRVRELVCSEDEDMITYSLK